MQTILKNADGKSITKKPNWFSVCLFSPSKNKVKSLQYQNGVFIISRVSWDGGDEA